MYRSFFDAECIAPKVWVHTVAEQSSLSLIATIRGHKCGSTDWPVDEWTLSLSLCTMFSAHEPIY